MQRNVLSAALFLATSALARPHGARVKRWLGFGGYGGYGAYDLGYAYGCYDDRQLGEIIALICGILAFVICICCPCICFLGIWFAGWFGIRQKRRNRPAASSVQLAQTAQPAAAAPTIIQQNPPPAHYSYNSAPPPPAHGESNGRGQYVYEDRYYERRHTPNREKYYR